MPTVAPSIKVNELGGGVYPAGSRVLFTTTGGGGGASPQYSWSLKKNGANFTSGTGSSYLSSSLLEGSYQLTFGMTSNEACASPAYVSTSVSFTVAAATITLNPSLPPSATAGTGGSGEVGSASGNFATTPLGGAAYQVPIAVPPGTAGMQPNISIVYNSQGGDGFLGWGFGLEGLSSITRASSTVYHDGQLDGVDGDALDRLSLDGQRLILASGTYLANGSTYHTENHSFSDISLASNGSGQGSGFTVKLKSGLTYQYGTVPNAIGPNIWLLNEVRDPKGNYMTITYSDETSGVKHPLRVDYTFNGHTGLKAYASVVFEYQSRSVNEIGWAPLPLEGKILVNLKRIKVFYGNALVRKYEMDYVSRVYSSQYSYLASITEFNSENKALNPIRFEWPAIEGGFQASQVALASNTIDYVATGDFNGDGKSDILYRGLTTPYPPYSTPDMLYVGFAASNNTFTGPVSFGANALASYIKNLSQVGDFNGDGMSDYMVVYRDGDYAKIRICYGGSLSVVSYTDTFDVYLFGDIRNNIEFATADFDGDGRTDIMFIERQNSNTRGHLYRGSGISGTSLGTKVQFDIPTYGNYTLNRVSYNKSQNVFTGSPSQYNDFNGDGAADLLVVDWDKTSMYEVKSGSPTLLFSTTHMNSKTVHICGDFDGDGRTDIFFYYPPGQIPSGGHPDNPAYMLMGRYGYQALGAYYTYSQMVSGGGLWGGDYRFGAMKRDPAYISHFVADLDGDGKDEILMVQEGTDGAGASGMHVASYYGEAFGLYEPEFRIKHYGLPNTLPQGTPQGMLSFVDFNGDGNLEVFHPASKYQYRLFLGQSHRMVSKITNSLGASIQLAYKPLTDASVYTKGTGAAYPVADLQASIQVLSSSAADNGVGGLSATVYQYEALKAHLQGKGLLGFQKTTTTDQTTGISVVNQYEYHPAKYAVALKKQTVKSGTATLEETEMTNSLRTYMLGSPIGSISPLVYSYEVVGTVSRKYILGTGALYHTAENTYTYDDGGNLTIHTAKYTDSQTSASAYSTIRTTHTYFPDSQYGLPLYGKGKVKETTVQKTLPTAEPLNKTAYVYDAAGYLIKVTREPGASGLETVTELARDAYGNVISESQRWSGQTRTTTQTFDAQGRFVASRKNALNHEETMTYDIVDGSLLSHKDPNLQVSLWGYDAWGRPAWAKAPDGTESKTVYFWAKGASGAPLQAEYGVLQAATGEPSAIAYYDRLGRPLREQTKGFNGQVVVSDTEYNPKGQVARVSMPYFLGSGTARWTTYAYDAIGRATAVNSPGKAGGTFTTTYAYNGNTTSATADGKTYQHKVNELGQLVLARDPANSQTTYHYDWKGNLKQVVDPNGNATDIQYDLVGNKTAMTVPGMGQYTYTYNGFGEVLTETSPSGQTNFQYDALGRMIARGPAATPTQHTTWTYDTHLKGYLRSVNKPANGAADPLHQETYVYDNFGRLLEATETIAGANYTTKYAYNGTGKIDRVTYPGPGDFKVEYVYNGDGYLQKVQKSVTEIYWQATQANALGQIERFELSQGEMATVLGYEPSTGMLTSIKTTKVSNSALLQDLRYDHDPVGNLLYRQDALKARKESFTYDALYRLASSTVTNTANNTPVGAPVSITYNALGSITYKSDVGSYTYASGKPHAVDQVTNAAGQAIPVSTATFQYTAFQKVSRVEDGNARLELTYGHDRQRRQAKLIVSEQLQLTRTYLGGGLCEREQQGTADRYLRYVFAGGSAVAVVTHTVGQGDVVRYFHHDHLGSPQAVTDAVGQVQESLSFDPWGLRRDAATWAPGGGSQWARGFTGHEHYDLFGLVDMNGRVYDPRTGQFTSGDPVVPDPFDLQALNRYAYVRNNPLAFTDPSGHVWNPVGALIGVAVGSFGSAVVAARHTDNKWAIGSAFLAGGLAGGLLGGNIDNIAGLVQGLGQGIGKGVAKGAGYLVQVGGPAPGPLLASAGNAVGYVAAQQAGCCPGDDVGYVLYEINKWNPLAIVVNSIKAIFTGTDTYGVPMSGGEAAFNLATVYPPMKITGKSAQISANLVRQALSLRVVGAAKTSSNVIHHIASNKHISKYTPQFESIANKYGLKLDEAWNKVDISDVYHYSKHPNQYHDFVLDGMMRADMGAAGNQAKFLQLFDQYVKQPLLQNPNMLNKTGW